MAIVPFAVKKLIKPGANDPRVRLRAGILHVDAGNVYDLHDWFDGPSGGIESHLHIPRGGAKPFQYRDTDYEADANYRANPFAMSVETQGYADGEWDDDQLDWITRIILFGEEHHDIPIRKIDRWDGFGWGYHTMFPEWYPEAKSCPGRRRIEQYNDIIVPWMDGNLTTVGGARMTTLDDDFPFWVPGDKDGKTTKSWAGDDGKMPLKQQLQQARGLSHSNSIKLDAVKRQNDAIIKSLGALSSGMGPKIEAAVTEALKDAVIDVDINVNQGE